MGSERKSSGIDEDYLDSRSKLATREEKGGSEWGGDMAQRIWDGLYSRHAPAIDGATILDIGCSWGYLLKHIEENFKPAKMIGTDIRPWWEIEDHGWDYNSLADRLRLIASDLTEVEEIPVESIDLAMCTSVLQYLTPENVEANIEKAYSLIKPGGEMILRTRVWSSAIGADLHRDIGLPYAHLLYSKAETDKVLEEKGKPAKYLNWLDSNSYLAIFHRVGFEMIDVRRRLNHHAENVASRVLEMYPWVEPKEVLCAELEVRMVKPFEQDSNNSSDFDSEMIINETIEQENKDNCGDSRCVVCDTSASEFEEMNGVERRRCPTCGSVERTRGVLNWIRSNEEVSELEIFAVAPASATSRFISEMCPKKFDRCDIRPINNFEITADITNMPEVKGSTYDLAMAIKVLEHCHDDLSAISEIHRILRPGGRLIVNGDISDGRSTREMDDPTSYYGKDGFEEYNIGTFRRYGLKDIEAVLSSLFEIKTYVVKDPPTNYEGFIIECTKQEK